MQLRLVRGPSPAGAPIQCDVGERVEVLEPRRSLRIPAVCQVSVPEMKDSAGHVADGTLDRIRKRSRPREVMLGTARIHPVRNDGIVQPPQRSARVGLVAGSRDARVVQPMLLEQLASALAVLSEDEKEPRRVQWSSAGRRRLPDV